MFLVLGHLADEFGAVGAQATQPLALSFRAVEAEQRSLSQSSTFKLRHACEDSESHPPCWCDESGKIDSVPIYLLRDETAEIA